MRRTTDLLPMLRVREGLSPIVPAAASPFSMMRRMQKDMDRLFSQVLSSQTSLSGQAGLTVFSPSADLSETDKEIRLDVELPGIKLEDVNIEIRDNHLVLTAQSRSEAQSEAGRQFHRRERRIGCFQEVLPLPPSVNEDKISARFDNGILHISLPKAEKPAPPGRRIEVQSSGAAVFPGSQTSGSSGTDGSRADRFTANAGIAHGSTPNGSDGSSS